VLHKVLRYSSGLPSNQFLDDELTLDACLRNLEVLGEAAKQNTLRESGSAICRFLGARIAVSRDVLAHATLAWNDDQHLADCFPRASPAWPTQLDQVA